MKGSESFHWYRPKTIKSSFIGRYAKKTWLQSSVQATSITISNTVRGWWNKLWGRQVTPIMVVRLTGTGRKRWKIENEGFNNQKNHRFAMGHICSHNYTAIKNHYMLIQIVDTLRQIYELKAYENRGLQVNIKNISSDLLAHFGRILTREDIFHSQQQGMNALC